MTAQRHLKKPERATSREQHFSPAAWVNTTYIDRYSYKYPLPPQKKEAGGGNFLLFCFKIDFKIKKRRLFTTDSESTSYYAKKKNFF